MAHTTTTRFSNSLSTARSGGMALPTALLVLVTLTLLGTAAVFTSATELDIAGNGRQELQALSVADEASPFAAFNLICLAVNRAMIGEIGEARSLSAAAHRSSASSE